MPRQNAFNTDFRQPSKLENIIYRILAGAPGLTQYLKTLKTKDGRAVMGKSLPTPQAVHFLFGNQLGDSLHGIKCNQRDTAIKTVQVWRACCSFKPRWTVAGDSSDSYGWAIAVELCQYIREQDHRL